MRFSNPGYLLWFFVAVAMAAPIWYFSSGGHPLVNADSVDACKHARLAGSALQPSPTSFEAPKSSAGKTAINRCQLLLGVPSTPGAVDSVDSGSFVSVVVMSQKMMTGAGIRGKTTRWMDRHVSELKADGKSPTPIDGPWRSAVLATVANAQRLEFIAEDGGVIVQLSARGLDRENVIRFAEVFARSLRKKV